jgi:hypothetical protein
MLTEEMIGILEKQRLGFVATIDDAGAPALSPKGTFIAISPTEIAFGDIRSLGTRRNLSQRPQTEVNFVDPLSRRGFRAKGIAHVLSSETTRFQELRPLFDRWGDLAKRIRCIVTIDIGDASIVRTPAYDDGAREEDLRSHWLEILTSDTCHNEQAS